MAQLPEFDAEQQPPDAHKPVGCPVLAQLMAMGWSLIQGDETYGTDAILVNYQDYR